MKKYDVHIGHLYAANIAGHIKPVQILYGVEKYGMPTHWIAANLETGEQLEIKSGASLKYEMVQGADGTLRRA